MAVIGVIGAMPIENARGVIQVDEVSREKIAEEVSAVRIKRILPSTSRRGEIALGENGRGYCQPRNRAGNERQCLQTFSLHSLSSGSVSDRDVIVP